jgi:hypothetical protein
MQVLSKLSDDQIDEYMPAVYDALLDHVNDNLDRE